MPPSQWEQGAVTGFAWAVLCMAIADLLGGFFGAAWADRHYWLGVWRDYRIRRAVRRATQRDADALR